LPRWRYLDLDEVLPDPAIEAALRAAGIDRIRRPSRGFLAASGIRSLAMIEPIHVMRRCDRWYCLVGWDLLKEAQEILQAPRIFPVCVHDAVTPEDMRGYILSEQIALPVRHQMSSDALTGFIGTLLDVTRKNTSHFLRLKAGQWVSFIGRSLRWLRSYTTTWEKRANHG
jgi:predicted DNA-binding transcriptional regulator YafY